MEFTGASRRLQPNDFQAAASTIGCNEAHIRTVCEVETSGKGFDRMGHVEHLFEPHRFYAELRSAGNTAGFNLAVRKGLAYPHWKGPGSYPKTPELRWNQFLAAVSIDQTCAIKAASWGLGQIMGSEYLEAGYASPQDMLESFQDSEKNQLIGMCKLIKRRGLDVQLRRFPDMTACRAFAKSYNGAAYAKNNYHVKLHDAYVRWSARKDIVSPTVIAKPLDNVMRVGEVSPRVKELEKLFVSKNYLCKVESGENGIFGRGLRDTVLAWKANNDRPITPEMDPEDVQDLIDGPAKPVSAERQETTVAELKPTSTIIKDTSTIKKGGIGLGGLLSVAQVADSSGLLDKAQEITDKAGQAKGIVVSAKEIVVDSGVVAILHNVAVYKFWILAIGVVIGLIIVNKIQKRRLAMHQNAEVG